ncbi:Neuropeptide Y receptor, partial [Tyrophagus putrescentiae]
FNIPFNLVRILPLSWPFGDLVCVLVPLIQYSCVYVSTFTMTLIALHRLWTVRQRRSSVGKTSGTKVALTVLAIWLVALTLSLPHAAFNRVKAKQFNGRILTRCAVRYPHVNFNFPLLLTVEVFFTQYLLPLSITLVVYVKIARVIARQGQLICKLSDEKKRRQSEQKRRRIFMLASLAVATFATCWMPINLYLFLVDSRVVHLQTEIFIMCHWFAMSSVCYNPIIYCWLNEKFRNGAKQTIRAILSFARFPMAEKHGSNLTNSTILSI